MPIRVVLADLPEPLRDGLERDLDQNTELTVTSMMQISKVRALADRSRWSAPWSAAGTSPPNVSLLDPWHLV
jgi:hypothetical protein